MRYASFCYRTSSSDPGVISACTKKKAAANHLQRFRSDRRLRELSDTALSFSCRKVSAALQVSSAHETENAELFLRSTAQTHVRKNQALGDTYRLPAAAKLVRDAHKVCGYRRKLRTPLHNRGARLSFGDVSPSLRFRSSSGVARWRQVQPMPPTAKNAPSRRSRQPWQHD